MKRALPRIGAALAIALVIAPALASAPRGQYDDFNRTSAVIHDTKTRLTWQRFVDGARYPLAGAVTFCGKYDAPDHVSRNWRLPTVKELLTLVDEEPHLEYPIGGTGTVVLYIDGRAFPDTSSGEYWTSSVGPGSRPYFYVDFSTGEIARAPHADDTNFVRCVSDGP